MFRCLVTFMIFLAGVPSLLAGGRIEKEWQALEERSQATKGIAALRADLFQFRLKHPGTEQALKAAALLRDLPSPLDQLDPKKNIPSLEQFKWFPKETVAVLGEHRGRQGGAVTAVAFSRNGKWLGSTSTSGHVRLWEASTMRLLHTMGHGAGGYCLAFAKDNSFLVHGGGDGNVHVQDLTADPPKLKATCKVASTPLMSIALGPGSKWFVTGGSDSRLFIWDLSVDPPVQITAADNHTAAIYAVAISADGKTIASAGADKTIRLWSFAEGKIRERGSVPAHDGIVYALTWHPTDEKTLVSASDDGRIRVWTVRDGKLLLKSPLQAPKTAEAAAYSVAFSASGNTIASTWSDNIVRVHGLGSGGTLTPKSLLEGHIAPPKGVAFAPDSSSIASGGDDWTVRLWPPTGPRPRDKTIKGGHLSHVYTTAFAPDEKGLASGGYDNSIRFWDVASGATKERVCSMKREGYIYTVAYSPDAKNLAAAGASTKVFVIDSATARLATTLKGHDGYVNQVTFSPSGSLASSANDKSIRLWNIKNARQTDILSSFENQINAVSFSADGKDLACCTGTNLRDAKGYPVYRNGVAIYADSTVRIYDTSLFKESYRWKNETVLPYGVCFTADGKHLLAGATDGALRRWETASPKEPEALIKAGGGPIYSLARSPDGRYMAAYGPAYQVQVFDAANGKTIKTFPLGEQFGSVSFAPDSRHIAISVGTGVILVLRIEESKNKTPMLTEVPLEKK